MTTYTLAAATVVFALALAPAEQARGQGTAEHVAEIVTFRLQSGVDDAAFLEAAATTIPFVEAAPGFLSRRLTRGVDGTWTDYVVWSSMANAKAAAEALMADPAVLPFLEAIDPESITMRHEAILMQME